MDGREFEAMKVLHEMAQEIVSEPLRMVPGTAFVSFPEPKRLRGIRRSLTAYKLILQRLQTHADDTSELQNALDEIRRLRSCSRALSLRKEG